MKVYSLREQSKNPAEYQKVLRAQSKDILSIMLKAFLEAESSVYLIKIILKISFSIQARRPKP